MGDTRPSPSGDSVNKDIGIENVNDNSNVNQVNSNKTIANEIIQSVQTKWKVYFYMKIKSKVLTLFFLKV